MLKADILSDSWVKRTPNKALFLVRFFIVDHRKKNYLDILIKCKLKRKVIKILHLLYRKQSFIYRSIVVKFWMFSTNSARYSVKVVK